MAAIRRPRLISGALWPAVPARFTQYLSQPCLAGSCITQSGRATTHSGADYFLLTTGRAQLVKTYLSLIYSTVDSYSQSMTGRPVLGIRPNVAQSTDHQNDVRNGVLYCRYVTLFTIAGSREGTGSFPMGHCIWNNHKSTLYDLSVAQGKRRLDYARGRVVLGVSGLLRSGVAPSVPTNHRGMANCFMRNEKALPPLLEARVAPSPAMAVPSGGCRSQLQPEVSVNQHDRMNGSGVRYDPYKTLSFTGSNNPSDKRVNSDKPPQESHDENLPAVPPSVPPGARGVIPELKVPFRDSDPRRLSLRARQIRKSDSGEICLGVFVISALPLEM
ncbi:hypothetical protein Bbelb_213180 [Branchiostoma belcheri]|nr:hypothetical protein Bbelb_213180 [Branchiostoma belcheri]